MNRIVRDHYPVSKLPEELRREAAPATHVRLTMEQLPREGVGEGHVKHRSKLAMLGIVPEDIQPVSLADIASVARPTGTTPAQAVRRIRRLRAERDDR